MWCTVLAMTTNDIRIREAVTDFRQWICGQHRFFADSQLLQQVAKLESEVLDLTDADPDGAGEWELEDQPYSGRFE
jgi:hypothetical protein